MNGVSGVSQTPRTRQPTAFADEVLPTPRAKGLRSMTHDPHDLDHRRKAAVLLAATAVFAIYAVTRVHAADGHPAPAGPTLEAVIKNVRDWLVTLLATLATTFLTIGGVKYLIASGDPGEVERAKHALRSAAIGYGLAVLAPALVAILQQIVGTG